MRSTKYLFQIEKYFLYDPHTGIVTHKVDTRMKTAGNIAGKKGSDGYIRIYIGEENFLAHRLGWFLHYGKWPKELDHINGVRTDNRIENLRECLRSQNSGNSAGWKKENKKYNLPRGVRSMKGVDMPHSYAKMVNTVI